MEFCVSSLGFYLHHHCFLHERDSDFNESIKRAFILIKETSPVCHKNHKESMIVRYGVSIDANKSCASGNQSRDVILRFLDRRKKILELFESFLSIVK